MTQGIPACMRCASRDLHLPGGSDGAVVGVGLELNEWVCLRCGWKGIPVFFDDEEAYSAFRRSVRDD